MSETRQDRETRQAFEYDVYLGRCKADGIEATSFMNWHFSKKVQALKVQEDKLMVAYDAYVIEERSAGREPVSFDHFKLDERVKDREKETGVVNAVVDVRP